MPEIEERVDCAEKQLAWFKRDPRTEWIAAAGKSSGDIADGIMQHLEAHS